MRLLLLLVFIITSTMAADVPTSAAATEASPVNTICVVCGKAIDPKVTAVPEIAHNGKRILIGCCSDACADEVRKASYLYVDAATENKKLDLPMPAGTGSATPAKVR